MTMQVFKYQLNCLTQDDEGTIELPIGAQIVHVKMNSQPSSWTLWVMVDATHANETRRFRACGTGHPLDYPAITHLATELDGPFVWHLFEIR